MPFSIKIHLRVKSAFMLLVTAILICCTLFNAPSVALPYGKKLSVAVGEQQIRQNIPSLFLMSHEEAEQGSSPTPEQIREWVAIAIKEAEQERMRRTLEALDVKLDELSEVIKEHVREAEKERSLEEAVAEAEAEGPGLFDRPIFPAYLFSAIIIIVAIVLSVVTFGSVGAIIVAILLLVSASIIGSSIINQASIIGSSIIKQSNNKP